MKFTPTGLAGSWIVDLDRHGDDRGFFARMFCAGEFREHGLKDVMVQGNISFSRIKGTLRGMHYQLPPASEAKLVRCTRGGLYDVIIDLRPESPTNRQYFGVDLTAENRRALYVPEGFAHGFLTLTSDAEASYLVSEYYTPAQERGIRYDDPAIGIQWPGDVAVISPKDASWPAYESGGVARPVESESP